MKTSGILTAVLVLMLTGCAAQTGSPAGVQSLPPQAENPGSFAASAEHPVSFAASAEEPQQTGAAENSAPADMPEAEPQQTVSAEGSRETAAPEELISGMVNSETEDTMRLLIGETEVPVVWEGNASVEALRALCPLTIRMSMYGGFEQVGPIGQSIFREDIQTDTSCGDIVLYSGDQIVIFYGSNSWAYTRLGHITLPQEEISALLCSGDVSVTLE